MGSEIFRTCPDRPCDPPNLLYNGYRVFPGGKERPGRDADPSPLLVPRSWKSRAIPLLPYGPYGLYRAPVPVQGWLLPYISGCTRVTFTCTYHTLSLLTFWRRNYFFLILAHSVYKMWIIPEPNKLELWIKLHFKEKKTESIHHV